MKAIIILLAITLIGGIIWLNSPVNYSISDTPIASTIKSYTRLPIDKSVIAKWKNEKNNNKVIEFFSDNTFSVTDGDRPFQSVREYQEKGFLSLAVCIVLGDHPRTCGMERKDERSESWSGIPQVRGGRLRDDSHDAFRWSS
jgi:hypothetical protein